jgi:hypothetical protein
MDSGNAKNSAEIGRFPYLQKRLSSPWKVEIQWVFASLLLLF